MFDARLKHRYRTFSQGVAQDNLSQEKLLSIKLQVPEKVADQARIADVLAAYDELIANNTRRIELLERSAGLLFDQWFVWLRYAGHEHAKIVDGLPEGWERVPLENALVLQRGFDLPNQSRRDGSIPIYGSTGIGGYHDEARVAAPGVVTGRSGTLGEVHFVRENFWPLNTALWVKEFRRVTPLYALFLLRTLDLKKYNGGASVPTLDRKSVHRIAILIPPRDLIVRFDKIVTPSFDQIGNLGIQNERLRQARDLLLPRLIDGRIEV
jgi:type I restriction enzyme, S subunit